MVASTVSSNVQSCLELYRLVPLKSARYFTSCALKPLPQSTKRIPDGPSPLTITANTPRTHQVTHFSDLWPAQSFRKWIKDCCHPLRHAHKATLCYIASCKHWQATILQTHRKALRQIRATTGIINKDKQFKTPLHKPFKTVENLSRHVKTFQVYKDPSACTMASKAAQAELARKRCTPSSGVLVLPNTEVDSVAGVVEPSRDTHGYWPQKGASPFPKKGRLKAPADIHPGTQKQELAPNTSQPCQSPYKVALKRWRYPSIFCSISHYQCDMLCFYHLT